VGNNTRPWREWVVVGNHNPTVREWVWWELQPDRGGMGGGGNYTRPWRAWWWVGTTTDRGEHGWWWELQPTVASYGWVSGNYDPPSKNLGDVARSVTTIAPASATHRRPLRPYVASDMTRAAQSPYAPTLHTGHARRPPRTSPTGPIRASSRRLRPLQRHPTRRERTRIAAYYRRSAASAPSRRRT